MKRRDFIQKTVAGSALMTLGGLSLSSFNSIENSTKTKKITNELKSTYKRLKK